MFGFTKISYASLAYTSLVCPILKCGMLGSIQGMSDKCLRPCTK